MEEHLQRLLLAGVLGLTIARKAAAILDAGQPGADQPGAGQAGAGQPGTGQTGGDPAGNPADGAVLRAILDAANECLGHFDDRPASERWCDAMLHLLDLARFAADLG